jgi:hypothetical protein
VSRRFALAVVALLAAVLIAGCGIEGQAQPELLAADDVPDGLLEDDLPTSTTTPHALDTSEADVYFVRGLGDNVRLRPVTRDVSEPDNVEERLIALLEQPPDEDEADQGFSTAIPPDTVLDGPVRVREGGLVEVNLSREFLDNEGQAQRTAFAQVVMTATDAPGIARVRFQIEGENHAAIIGDGTTRERAVSRDDYRRIGYAPPANRPNNNNGNSNNNGTSNNGNNGNNGNNN